MSSNSLVKNSAENGRSFVINNQKEQQLKSPGATQSIATMDSQIPNNSKSAINNSSSGKPLTKNQTNSSSSSKEGRIENGRRGNHCCRCLGPKSTAFWLGLLTNLGICTLLFAYTLLGSFLFLAIEGDSANMPQKILASTNRQSQTSSYPDSDLYSAESGLIGSSNSNANPRPDNITFSPTAIHDALEARQRTVENIWDITVSLNILYRENWTRLAALEIARFQDQLIKRLTEDMASQIDGSPSTGAVMVHSSIHDIDWTFARAFLYSLTVLTTIGYGNLAPRTSLGRVVTMAYAILGIPLTLIYLSSTGGVLAKVARGVFSRALCCCLCSNCGYCCYDEKRMAEKERKMKKKRQQEELRAQQMALQEPYYVRSGGLHSPEKQINYHPEIDSLSTCTESKASMHGLSLLAPILLCFSMMVIYIFLGALALYRLENWPLLDGVYFCFMSLSTIGFGDLVPGLRKDSSNTTTWFCSIYIMSGMALTAMCFNVLHEEIVHRLKHVVVDIKKSSSSAAMHHGCPDDLTNNDFMAS